MELGLEYINYFAAAMALVGLVITLLWYKSPRIVSTPKPIREIFAGMKRVFQNLRFMALIVIVAGFWIIQGQLYATMPKYTIRLIGEHASPEWLANINPFIVVLCVIPITHLVRRIRPVGSIAIAMFLIPISALTIALSPLLQTAFGTSIDIAGIAMHPITIMMILGIALQGLAECFLSPRFYEYASKQAPKNEEGLYMGYSYLTTFFAWLTGFIMSGYLLEAFCPDPKTLAPDQVATAYAHAHYIWYIFAAIGFAAFLLLLVFKSVTDRIDRHRHIPEPAPLEEPVPFIEEE